MPATKTPKTLLVSPLGLSRGLLYSALTQVSCDECLVIASQQSVSAIEEIKQKANYQGEITSLIMQDPFTGFGETKSLLAQCKDIMSSASTIVCNITGGTTAQQFVTQALFDQARKMKRQARRVAMIDRRDPTEQRNNPYIKGELVDLEEKLRE